MVFFAPSSELWGDAPLLWRKSTSRTGSQHGDGLTPDDGLRWAGRGIPSCSLRAGSLLES